MHRLLKMSELQEGQTYSETVSLTADKLRVFIELSGDSAPVHVDSEHAKKMGYEKCLVHGFMVNSGYSRLLGMFLPGGNTVIHRVQLDMLAPVFVGDDLTYEVKVLRISPAVKSVELELRAKNQSGVVVSRGKASCVFRLEE